MNTRKTGRYRSRKLKTKQYNCQKKKENDLQHTTQKIKDFRETQTQKTALNSCASEG